jgi:hypothetical protein
MGLIEQTNRERQRPDTAGLDRRRDGTIVESDNLRSTRIALKSGSGASPALGYGTLTPEPIATRTATNAALEAGFRLLDGGP